MLLVYCCDRARGRRAAPEACCDVVILVKLLSEIVNYDLNKQKPEKSYLSKQLFLSFSSDFMLMLLLWGRSLPPPSILLLAKQGENFYNKI